VGAFPAERGRGGLEEIKLEPREHRGMILPVKKTSQGAGEKRLKKSCRFTGSRNINGKSYRGEGGGKLLDTNKKLIIMGDI